MTDTEKCARDILVVIKKVHYSPEFRQLRMDYGTRGEFEYIIDYIEKNYLDTENKE